MTEIVYQCRLLRHQWQTRVAAHQKELAGMLGAHFRTGVHLHVAVHQVRDGRARDYALHFVHFFFFQFVSAFRH